MLYEWDFKLLPVERSWIGIKHLLNHKLRKETFI